MSRPCSFHLLCQGHSVVLPTHRSGVDSTISNLNSGPMDARARRWTTASTSPAVSVGNPRESANGFAPLAASRQSGPLNSSNACCPTALFKALEIAMYAPVNPLVAISHLVFSGTISIVSAIEIIAFRGLILVCPSLGPEIDLAHGLGQYTPQLPAFAPPKVQFSDSRGCGEYYCG